MERVIVWNFGGTPAAETGDTELAICNEALVLIGQAEITSLYEDSDAARACLRLYSLTRDAVLRAYPWTRAMKYDTLTVDATEPAWGYSYRYALPDDLLRLLGLDYSKYTFKVVGGYVYTNEVSDDLNIRYTARITAPADWDALLRKAVAMRLSHALAVPLTGDKTLAKLQWELYQLVIREARSIDGQEGTIDSIESNDFTDFRA